MADLKTLLKNEFEDIEQFEKDDSKIKNWLSWGNYALNYICSKDLNKGIPQGKVSSISGLSGTGKSLLSANLINDPKIDAVLIYETEGAPIDGLLNFMNVDLDKVHTTRIETFSSYKVNKKTGKTEEISDAELPNKKDTDTYVYREGLTSKMRRLINQVVFNKTTENILIILDSIANMQSVRALSGNYDMGKRSIDISNFFRTFDNAFERTNIFFLFTNKLYTTFNQYQPYAQSGGLSVEYNPSLSIRLANTYDTDDITDSDLKTEKDRRKTALGSSIKQIKATIKKSRFGTESRNINFLLDFSTGGMNRISGLFTLLKEFGVIQNATSRSYKIPEVFEGTFFKKDFIIKVLENEEEIIGKLQVLLEKREKEILREKAKMQMSDVIDEDEVNEEDLLEGPDRADLVKDMGRDADV